MIVTGGNIETAWQNVFNLFLFVANYLLNVFSSTDLLLDYLHSEHGLGQSEEVGTGTKARLRISAFRDSAVARA